MKIKFPNAGIAAFLAACSLASTPSFAQEAPKPIPGLDKINHIIVLYLERTA